MDIPAHAAIFVFKDSGHTLMMMPGQALGEKETTFTVVWLANRTRKGMLLGSHGEIIGSSLVAPY